MQKKIGLGLQILISLLLLSSAVMKIIAYPDVVKGFIKANLQNYILPIGIAELILTVLWLVPITRKPGFYLLCSYLGGAICTNLITGDTPIPAAIALALGWVSMYLQDRSVL